MLKWFKDWFAPVEDTELEDEFYSDIRILLQQAKSKDSIDRIRDKHTVDKISMHKGRLGGYKWTGYTTNNLI